MIIADHARDRIRSEIALHPPERGGALYGPADYPMISHFEYDDAAVTTADTYTPSRELIRNIARVERETGLKFKGIVHSHPAGINKPSSTDKRAVASLFRDNRHLAWIFLPIVQQVGEEDLTEFLHWFRAEPPHLGPGARYSTHDAQVLPVEVGTLPVRRDFLVLLDHLKSYGWSFTPSEQFGSLSLEHARFIQAVARGADADVFFNVTADYPFVAPLVLVGGPRRDCVVARFPWDCNDSSSRNLEYAADAVRTCLEKPADRPNS